jgi:1-phosphatidylinositol-4-phosphate 5-kinase
MRFIIATTKTQEEVNRERVSGAGGSLSIDNPSRGRPVLPNEQVEKQAARMSEKDGAGSGDNQGEKPERTLAAVRSPSAERTNGVTGAILPVVEEAGEAGSTSGRSRDESTLATQRDEKDTHVQ